MVAREIKTKNEVSFMEYWDLVQKCIDCEKYYNISHIVCGKCGGKLTLGSGKYKKIHVPWYMFWSPIRYEIIDWKPYK